MIEQQKKEIENLKAASMQMDPEKLIEAMTQAMACMYYISKDPSRKISGTKPLEGKPYLGKTKQPQITKGLDGTTDPNLTCQYCKDSGHELDNCKKLQQKIQWEQLVAESIIVEKVLNKKHPLKGSLIDGAKSKDSLFNLDKGKAIQAEVLQVKYKIMRQAVASSPKVNLECMGEKLASLLDSGSMVSPGPAKLFWLVY